MGASRVDKARASHGLHPPAELRRSPAGGVPTRAHRPRDVGRGAQDRCLAGDAGFSRRRSPPARPALHAHPRRTGAGLVASSRQPRRPRRLSHLRPARGFAQARRQGPSRRHPRRRPPRGRPGHCRIPRTSRFNRRTGSGAGGGHARIPHKARFNLARRRPARQHQPACPRLSRRCGAGRAGGGGRSSPPLPRSHCPGKRRARPVAGEGDRAGECARGPRPSTARRRRRSGSCRRCGSWRRHSPDRSRCR
ncbi:hypothetical protein sos41_33220 [Alphaproteobacteria bacterium SO-S41]|nr:hypothetical protein sos41_33220 [Alphaproteobacteria bacterium SO-S41]